MKSKITAVASGILTAALFSAGADDSSVANSRYGLFNGLDHRSVYSQGNFPEPLLVDDSGLEVNESRLDWQHRQTGAAKSDVVIAEIEKGFGNLTLELGIPYEHDSADGQVAQGIGNLDFGARYPFYQYVSRRGEFDTTFGGAMELGIPASSSISVNPEFVPKIFNDTKIGDHFTAQSVFGYSTVIGGGDAGGRQTVEYGFTFGYSLAHSELPLPGIRQFIPLFELVGETGLNKDAAGANRLLGDAGIRVNLKTLGRLQPRLGLGFVFPLNNNARADVHWGLVTSLVFEY